MSKLVLPKNLGDFRKTTETSDVEVQANLKALENALSQIQSGTPSTITATELLQRCHQVKLRGKSTQLVEVVTSLIATDCEATQTALLKQASNADQILTEYVFHWERVRVVWTCFDHLLIHLETDISRIGYTKFAEKVLLDETVELCLLAAVADVLLRERQGEVVAIREIVRTFCSTYCAVPTLAKRPIKNGYYGDVLIPYVLESSRAYFRTLGQERFDSMPVEEYIHFVYSFEKDEKLRFERLFPYVGQWPELRTILFQTMVSPFLAAILSKESGGLRTLLEQGRFGDVNIIFRAFAEVGRVPPFVAVVKGFFTSQLKDFLFDKELNEGNPALLVDRLITTKLLTKQVHETCEFNPLIAEGCTAAIAEQLNANDRLPEYLSLYIDRLIRTFQVGKEESFEEATEHVLDLYRLLSERDVFDTYAAMHLAKRLLAGRSLADTDGIERHFLNRMKLASKSTVNCFKMEKMLNEVAGCEETMDKYREFGQAENGTELYVSVLTMGVWPIVLKSPTLVLPPEVIISQHRFSQFFKRQFHGRTLTYNYWLGSADIRMYDPAISRKYELNVMTTQMALLMLFNEQDVYSLSELAAKSGMDVKQIKASLQPLVKNQPTHSKLLTVDPTNSELISVNPHFKSKHIKIKITNVVIRESDEQHKITKDKLGEDRKWVLDATIVRLMKSRRQMDHKDLVVETIYMLKSNFTPSVEDIKKRIESLIERAYMERDEDISSRYYYKS
eukprot:PhF_6_TR11754/c0_g1_i1/m.19245/K03869/CUL3; cullin 3